MKTKEWFTIFIPMIISTISAYLGISGLHPFYALIISIVSILIALIIAIIFLEEKNELEFKFKLEKAKNNKYSLYTKLRNHIPNDTIFFQGFKYTIKMNGKLMKSQLEDDNNQSFVSYGIEVHPKHIGSFTHEWRKDYIYKDKDPSYFGFSENGLYSIVVEGVYNDKNNNNALKYLPCIQKCRFRKKK